VLHRKRWGKAVLVRDCLFLCLDFNIAFYSKIIHMLTRNFPLLEVRASATGQSGVILSAFGTCESACLCFWVNMYRSEFTIQSTTFPCFSSFATYVRPLTPLIIRPGRKRDAHISNPSDTESATGTSVQQTHSNLTGKIPMKTKPSAKQGGPFIIFSHKQTPHIIFPLPSIQVSWMNTYGFTTRRE
jgi:hypothetical protein